MAIQNNTHAVVLPYTPPELELYQVEGAHWLYNNFRGGLGDDPGLGKTVQALTATKQWPALVVCPNPLKDVWEFEGAKWLPGKKVVVVTGSRAQREALLKSPADIYVVNYEMVQRFFEPLCERKYGTIIFDEAHNLRNRKAKTTRYARMILNKNYGARVYFLSGTFQINKAEDLWVILSMIKPNEFTSFRRWAEQWLKQTTIRTGGGWLVTKFGAPKNVDAFVKHIEPYILRRTKEQVLSLPGVTEITVPIELEGKQRVLYDRMLNNFWADYGETEVDAINMLAKITRLRQIALDPTLLFPEYTGDIAKVELLKELIEERTDQIIVFSEFAEFVAKLGYPHVVGDTPNNKRTEIFDAFRNGDFQVLALSRTVGGYGLTLTNSNTVIFTDLPWTHAAMQQAIGRVDRIGQCKHCFAYKLVAKNTVDTHMESIIKEKYELNDSVIEEIARRLYTQKG